MEKSTLVELDLAGDVRQLRRALALDHIGLLSEQLEALVECRAPLLVESEEPAGVGQGRQCEA